MAGALVLVSASGQSKTEGVTMTGLQPITERERRNLVAVSTVGLFVMINHQPVTKINAVIVTMENISPWTVYLLLLLLNLYFLGAFHLYPDFPFGRVILRSAGID